MTNTERASAVQLDELDELPPWDDEETLDRLAAQLTAADTRTLAVYGLDSDQQTLVGLGPVERARRSRAAAEKLEAAERLEAAEKPDSQRMPQSEPPGPFIAAEDDELPAFRRPRKPGGWAIALAAVLLVGAASLVLVGGRAPESRPATQPPRAMAAPPLPPRAASEPPPIETPAAASVPPAEEDAPLPSASVSSASVSVSTASVSVSAASTAAASTPLPQRSQASANAPTGVAALPVKLTEVSAPVVVDRTSDTDVNVGTINVTSNPPANVVLDGRPLGKAPCVVRVPAGFHNLVFIHPLYGRRSLHVNVSPGMTTSASAAF
jgi:hypothetical protein